MSITILRTSDAWWVRTPGGAARIDTEATTTSGLLAEREQIEAARGSGTTIDPAALDLVSPVTAGCRVVAQMTNFVSHVKDSGLDPETVPLTFFRKTSGSLSGPFDDIVRPGHVRYLDYEVEIGLVIGRELPVGTQVTADNWTSFVAALVVTNDVSARDVQLPKTQFYESKSYPTFTPAGPSLVLLDDDERNVFLLGDAAHLTPPFIGQGLCAGLRDSMNLSWKIAGVLSRDLPETVLDTYEVERRPHARALIQLAKLVGVSMTQGGRAGGLLRRAVAPRLRWVPALRDRLLDSETPPLSRSELVDRRRLRKSLNGRLCPNAPLTNDIRYDDVTRGGFVFVTGVPLSPEQRAVLAGRGTEVLEVAPGSALYKWLADGKAAAALVRPDFTVLRVGRDVTALCEAAPRFLVA